MMEQSGSAPRDTRLSLSTVCAMEIGYIALGKDQSTKDRDAKDRDAKDRDAKDRDAKDRSRRERGERERERVARTQCSSRRGDAHKNRCCPPGGAGSSFLFTSTPRISALRNTVCVICTFLFFCFPSKGAQCEHQARHLLAA